MRFTPLVHITPTLIETYFARFLSSTSHAHARSLQAPPEVTLHRGSHLQCHALSAEITADRAGQKGDRSTPRSLSNSASQQDTTDWWRAPEFSSVFCFFFKIYLQLVKSDAICGFGHAATGPTEVAHDQARSRVQHEENSTKPRALKENRSQTRLICIDQHNL